MGIKGIKRSLETRKKYSNRMKEFWNNPNNKEIILNRNRKIGLKNKGKIVSEETKNKMSKIMKIISKEKGFGKWAKGRVITNEEKKKRSESAKEKGMGKWMKKVWAEGRASPNSLNAITKGNRDYLIGKPLSEEHRKKLSEARNKGINEGRIVPWNKGKECFYLNGEKNNFWKGGISFEPYDLNFNNQFRNKIRKRDNQICMLCGIHREKLSRVLSVHHINYDKKLSIPENCLSLCTSCHGLTNINREHWIKFFQSLLNKIYGYKYTELNEPILDVIDIYK